MIQDILLNLINWIRNNSGYVDENIFIEQITDNNRTLKINSDKKNSDILIRIPEICTINGSDFNNLCLNLLIEISKEKDSFYYPYINILPKNLDHIPLYKYNHNDLLKLDNIDSSISNLLRTSFNQIDLLFHEIIKKHNNIKSEYKTLEWTKYVFCIVRSRSWATYGLIPLIDMIQHTNDIKMGSAVTKNEKNELIFINRRDIQNNDELMHCYNHFEPIMQYMTYGIAENFQNSYLIDNLFLTDDGSDLYKFKKKCFIDNNIHVNHFIILYNKNNIDIMVLMIMKILNLTEKDLQYINIGTNESISLNTNKIFTLDNEHKTLKYCIKFLQSRYINEQKFIDYPDFYKIINNNNIIINFNITALQQYWSNILSNYQNN